MTTKIIFITILLFSLVSAKQNLADLAANTDLGRITLPVTDLKVLNAFVRANPQLPEALKVKNRNGLIYVSALYKELNKAVIDVRMNLDYMGHVDVYFNGGQPARDGAPERYPQTGNTWHEKLNLAVEPNLDTTLGNLRNTEPETIINAFMDKNPHLPSELRSLLRATMRKGRRSASLYVPQPNNRYEGNIIVTF